MKVAIIGTRGIPNNYGGFEQFAEYLSLGLVHYGHEVTVYNSNKHPYSENVFGGVSIVKCYDPEEKIGTAGQFIYDLNCILDTRKKQFDIILQLGYTSSSIWWPFLPKQAMIVTNMDGLEWKRTKYSRPVQLFLRFAERLAVKHSDYLVADSVGIKTYLKNKYQVDSEYIPYGAEIFHEPNQSVLLKFKLEPYNYNILVARLEPENSIEIILDGVTQSKSEIKFIVIGKHTTKYGEYLKEKYATDSRIVFLGSIYDKNELDNLRYFSNLYFHGHTVGGTNPSLLEAMGSQALICAHENEFNKAILGKEGLYFQSVSQVKEVIESEKKENYKINIIENISKIRNIYSWDLIIERYLVYFKGMLK